VWLYKAGLGNEAIKAAGIYYCPRLDRVVLPVVSDDRLVYWQARGFDPERPKYINPAIDKANLTARYGEGGPLVLVEDILSAIRVGEVARGWSLLGTNISDSTAARVKAARGVDNVLIWLDPDGAGRKARGRLRNALCLVGITPRIIRTDLDPKLYSREEIRRIVFEE
jgi:hypothetical protein